MLPLDFILYLQIIIFLFITPGTPRIVIISYSMNYGVGKCVWSALGDVTREEFAANLTAYASKMLDPGVLPEIPVPFATPLTEWQFPEPLQEFDYGPPPVLGAMMSPSAQSQMIWGQGIASIGSQVAGAASSFIPKN